VKERLDIAAADPRAGGQKRRFQAASAELAALPAAAGGGADVARLHGELTELAIDLGAADALPTAPQREVLELARQRLTEAERSFAGFAAGTLRRMEPALRRLEAAAPPPPAARRPTP
jgi:hypothetical protein